MSDNTICKVCNKDFKFTAQLKRHMNNKFPCVRSTSCKYCNKTFSTLGNLERHIQTEICLQEGEPFYKQHNATLEEKINGEIQILTEKLKEIQQPSPINNNITNNINNTNNIQNNNQNIKNKNNNVIVNLLTKEYIKENFIGDPCLKSLQDYGVIKHGNIITDPHYDDENIMFINTIVSQYDRGKLIEYFGDILITHYKKSNQISDQSLWCSDLSRSKFLVRILPYPDSPCNIWVTDSFGVMVKKEVIMPLLDYVVKCIDSYSIKYPQHMVDETDKFLILGDIVASIRNNSLTHSITKYMAPHFTLGQQLKIENKPEEKVNVKGKAKVKAEDEVKEKVKNRPKKNKN
jgi:hypothetical protein